MKRLKSTVLAGRDRLSQSAQLSASRPRKNPLFIVDLVLDNTGVHYSTPLEQFEVILLNLFDKGILATHAVPQLEKVRATGWAGPQGALRIQIFSCRSVPLKHGRASQVPEPST